MISVFVWELGEYWDCDCQLLLLIEPDWIVSQLGMTTISIGENNTKVWATINLSKVWVILQSRTRS